MNKKKIFNDPVYGFIEVTNDFIFQIIEHPYFQRLRRIKQLGLTDLVYPGALHTRFHHALGAMHLMGQALQSIASKGTIISEEEKEAAQIAILLHDVGHSPFSHALEYSILNEVRHERISLLTMQKLNEEFNGRLNLAIEIFNNHYHRPFFHQLISSQLDIDRLDYLNRDCFFTGVHEGTIGAERLIKMLNVHHDELVIDEKGIYSVENFITARRLMYWQVYLHKTTISAEKMAIQIIERAKHLIRNNITLDCPPSLAFFLKQDTNFDLFVSHEKSLDHFMNLDDYDIWYCIKVWSTHTDKTLSLLCTMLLTRRLFSIQLSNTELSNIEIEKIHQQVQDQLHLSDEELSYFMMQGVVYNEAYLDDKHKNINILYKNGELKDFSSASDLTNIKALSKIVEKHYICYPKSVSL